jgi:hypothetical protein
MIRGRPQAIGPKMERIEGLSIHNHTEKEMAGQEETPLCLGGHSLMEEPFSQQEFLKPRVLTLRTF